MQRKLIQVPPICTPPMNLTMKSYGQIHCSSSSKYIGNCLNLKYASKQLSKKTKMHSSRMYTVRCSSRLLGGGGLCPGESAQGGVCQTPPVNRMTDACENITLPQTTLRTVITTENDVQCNINCNEELNYKFHLCT